MAKKQPKVLDLNNKEQAEKEIQRYLKLECPHYLGGNLVSVKLVKDLFLTLFEGNESRVLVYDVRLDNNSDVFGTIGGLLYPHHPPYSNVFSKERAKDSEVAGKMHFYWEAVNRYGNTSVFGNKDNLKQLAEMLEIPKELR